jgi:hypothetical protein
MTINSMKDGTLDVRSGWCYIRILRRVCFLFLDFGRLSNGEERI